MNKHGLDALTKTVTFRETNVHPGDEDGDNSSLDGIHEPEIEPRLGTGETNQESSGGEEDGLLNIEVALERFTAQTRIRLKERSQRHYIRTFERFAEFSDLCRTPRQKVKSQQGKQLLLSFLDTLPRPSQRYAVAELKAVWLYGLCLPWPLDAKRDLGRFPIVRRRQTPSDKDVKAWADALNREPRTLLRLEWLLVAQTGLRPSHVYKLRWRNVRYDDEGKPYAIVADGAEEGFKTNSPVAARLPPDVAGIIENWRKEQTFQHPDGLLLPCGVAQGKPHEREPRAIRDHWLGLSKKWGVPPMRPVDMRHWVASACRRAGLSRVASAFMMGHDPSQGSGSMRDWYDSPQLEDIIQEQACALPNGPLGLLKPAEIELVEGLPAEAVQSLADYLEGKIGTLEFVNLAERLRLSQHDKERLPKIGV